VRLAIAFVLSAVPVAAQESSVADAADRPGFADSPALLGRRHVQVEFGFTNQHEGGDSGAVRSFTAPQSELHAGVTSRFDVSVSWDGFVSTTTPTAQSGTEQHDTGYADVRVGAKLAVIQHPRVHSALIAYLNAPVGSAFVTDHYGDPAARLAWSVAISERIGLSGTADVQAVRDVDDHVHAKPAASAAVSTALTGALNGFVGLVAEPASLRSRPGLLSVEGGLVLPFAARNQVDVWVSHRVAGDPDCWFVSAGFVRRLR
jgi:outer membrane putative beta-barrel porin/alpha-amylase